MEKLRDNGFTLIEIMAVLVMMSILMAVGIQRYVWTENTARYQAVATGAAELRSRESLTWFQFQLAGTYAGDADLFSRIDYDLGSRYSWIAGPEETGGELAFDGVSAALTRTPSTKDSVGSWQM